MRNEIEFFKDYAKIYIRQRNGNTEEVLVDIEDVDKIQLYRWNLFWKEDIQNYYVKTIEYDYYEKGKRKGRTILLHRYIMDANKDNYVDHMNHKTLDNRKVNLRITDNSQNNKNRNGKHRNNTSGYRNVTWAKSVNKWVVRLQINKKSKEFGYFDDVHKAGKHAEKMREKYYGEYKGKS